ncbi:tetratricopeptide repeat protein [Sorangium sp. So ce1335]|uniref:tetratricopeptide repeat protein n=1 Tax=Sorangium sp. So ce1335 TaxID=3133335 RepID=UPI003F62C6B5
MRYRHWGIASLLLGLLIANPAMAEETAPTAQPKATARALANEGKVLYDAGRYEDALRSFREAEAIVHAPTLLLMMARAHDKLGQFLEARAIYKRVIEEDLDTNAAPVFVQAQVYAKEEMASLVPRIPALKVVVRGAAGSAVALTLDGVKIEPLSFVERNPGDHVLIASMAGRRSVTRTIHLTEGERKELVLDTASLPIEPARNPAYAPVQGAPHRADRKQANHAPARTLARPNDAGGPNRALVYTGMALTGVAAGVGTVFGILSAKHKIDADDLHDQLETKDGPSACAGGQNAAACGTLLSTRKEGWNYTKISWGFFGGAAVAGAATLIYYWRASSPAEATAHTRVIPQLGEGSGGIVITGAW